MGKCKDKDLLSAVETQMPKALHPLTCRMPLRSEKQLPATPEFLGSLQNPFFLAFRNEGPLGYCIALGFRVSDLANRLDMVAKHVLPKGRLQREATCNPPVFGDNQQSVPKHYLSSESCMGFSSQTIRLF